jgi:membrane protease YdiL (CAAX protease family)
VPLYAVATPVMLLILHGLPKAPHNETYSDHGEVKEKSPFTVGKFLLLLVIGMGCMYIGSYIGQTLMSILSVITGFDYENSLNSMVTESPVWMTFVATVICAPLGEEFLFRKLLIDRTRRWGDLISILVSAFTFALFHGNFFQFFYAFFIGAILAYIYTRTGKLRWCVAMHAIVNFFGSILMPWIASFIPTEIPENTEDTAAMLDYLQENALGLLVSLAVSALIYGLMIAAVVLLCIFFRRIQLSRGSYPLTVSESISAALLNPGMISALVVMGFSLLGNLVTPLLPTGG